MAELTEFVSLSEEYCTFGGQHYLSAGGRFRSCWGNYIQNKGMRVKKTILENPELEAYVLRNNTVVLSVNVWPLQVIKVRARSLRKRKGLLDAL